MVYEISNIFYILHWHIPVFTVIEIGYERRTMKLEAAKKNKNEYFNTLEGFCVTFIEFHGCILDFGSTRMDNQISILYARIISHILYGFSILGMNRKICNIYSWGRL